MIRTFAAITPPDDVLDALEDLQEALPGAAWSPPENIHVTLCFFGEQSRHALEDLDAALAALDKRRFVMTLSGVGTFGSEPRLVFADVERSSALSALQAGVAAAARATGIDVERRKYAPHATLARWPRGAVRRDRLETWLSAHALFAVAPFEVERFTLFRSTLTRDGPIYDPMRDYPLS